MAATPSRYCAESSRSPPGTEWSSCSSKQVPEVVDAGTGSPSPLDLLRAIEQTGATEVVILPGMADVAPVAEVAARHARPPVLRVAVVPATEPVQALARSRFTMPAIRSMTTWLR